MDLSPRNRRLLDCSKAFVTQSGVRWRLNPARLIPVQVSKSSQSTRTTPHRNFGSSGAELPHAFPRPPDRRRSGGDFGKFFPHFRIPLIGGIQERDFFPIFFSEKKMGNLALATQAPQFRRQATHTQDTIATAH
jgi:hypothetical protein